MGDAMQAGVLNLLAISANANSNPNAGAAAGDPSSPYASDAPNVTSDFAKLLRDGGDKASINDRTTEKDSVTAAKDATTQPVVSGSALVAQEMNVLHAMLETTAKQTVTPADANALIDTLDVMSTQLSDQGGSAADQETLNQLKQQLQQIVDSGDPKTVSDMLAALNGGDVPADEQLMADGADSIADSIAGGASDGRASVASSQLMQRVVQIFHAALVKPANDVSQQADSGGNSADGTDGTDIMPDAVTQGLQAAMFRTDVEPDAADTQAAQSSSDDQKETDGDTTVTEIIPLSAQLIALPQWVNALPATPVTKTTSAAIAGTAPTVIGTIQASAMQVRDDLDDAIPPLALAKDEKQPLPSVNLPGLNEPVSEKNAVRGVANAGDAVNNAALNPSLLGGHVPTQTVNAVQPAHSVALPNLVNHAPVAEQVHVAIKNAGHDGLQQITIQLDPMDLGRVEVKMHTNSDGHTSITFTADKASTFDSLSRDARVLEHSLQEAGIKADAGSMQFNLRQQPQPQLQSDLGQGQGKSNQQASSDTDEANGKAISGVGSLAAAVSRYYNVNVHEGIDIHA